MRQAEVTTAPPSRETKAVSENVGDMSTSKSVASWEQTVTDGRVTPFFETDPNPNASRRLLLVFFYFAPSAEVGALRWLSFARFGAERGWATDVVTLHPKFMGTVDPARLSQLPRGIRLFGISGDSPAWYRTMLAAWRTLGRGGERAQPAPQGLAGHLDRSDVTEPLRTTGTGWQRTFRSRVHFALSDVLARRAAALGTALVRENRYDLVVSSGPPHAAHESARRVAERAGVPFVMDMRDPWSDESAVPEEFASTVWRRETGRRERECVSSARLVVVTSQAHEELQIAKYPQLRQRITTVMNGADADPLPARSPGKQFVIAFTGMIYLGRNPRPLFRAAARVARATGASPNEFVVEFMGDDSCDGIPLTTIATEEGLGAHFRSHGFRPRREALELLSRASLLVSLPLRTEMTLPAKLFEYTRFEAWLLALADQESATAKLLAGTNADVVGAGDVDAMEKVIASHYSEFRAGVRPVALNRDGRFDRTTQSARLFDALEKLAAAGPTRR